jgi:hypothetical protein
MQEFPLRESVSLQNPVFSCDLVVGMQMKPPSLAIRACASMIERRSRRMWRHDGGASNGPTLQRNGLRSTIRYVQGDGCWLLRKASVSGQLGPNLLNLQVSESGRREQRSAVGGAVKSDRRYLSRHEPHGVGSDIAECSCLKPPKDRNGAKGSFWVILPISQSSRHPGQKQIEQRR